jgi:hypothetical protein
VLCAANYFYSNDVVVLLESLMRRSINEGLTVMLPEYLKTIGTLCTMDKQFPRDRADENKLFGEHEIGRFYERIQSSMRAIQPQTPDSASAIEQINALAAEWDARCIANSKPKAAAAPAANSAAAAAPAAAAAKH